MTNKESLIAVCNTLNNVVSIKFKDVDGLANMDILLNIYSTIQKVISEMPNEEEDNKKEQTK